MHERARAISIHIYRIQLQQSSIVKEELRCPTRHGIQTGRVRHSRRAFRLPCARSTVPAQCPHSARPVPAQCPHSARCKLPLETRRSWLKKGGGVHPSSGIALCANSMGIYSGHCAGTVRALGGHWAGTVRALCGSRARLAEPRNRKSIFWARRSIAAETQVLNQKVVALSYLIIR